MAQVVPHTLSVSEIQTPLSDAARRSPRIDPASRRPDGMPADPDRVEIGPTELAFAEWREAGIETPDLERMREYRLNRVVAELQSRDLAGVLLFDPINIRYASDTSNMTLWVSHNFVRACLVTADGYMVLWDFHNCEHLSAHLPRVREVRHGASFFYFESGSNVERDAGRFAAEVADLLQTRVGESKRLAVDKIENAGYRALTALGLEVSDGQAVMEHARGIKGAEEIAAMRCALAATERCMEIMERSVQPGQPETDVWAVLHAQNIRRGGEWIECRLLSSGPRTNPWFQECGPRPIQAGDLLAFDTDLIGPYGICADLSRTWLVGDGAADAEQQQLYQVAVEHIRANCELLGPGVSFRELTERSHRLPEAYRPQRYGVIMHGVGMCDEYPSIRYPEDFETCGYDGVLAPGMVLCVEAYVGEPGGREGVKLEDQVLITETGFENLTRYPLDERLLG